MPKTIHAELQDLVAHLVKAGIPPEVIGAELMSTGAAFLHQKFGADHVARQCDAIKKAVRPAPEEDTKH